jgi:UPF0755 protein
MKDKFSRYFKVAFLFVLAFVIFYSLNQSATEEVFIVEHTTNKEELINKMLKDGYLRKDMSYYFLKVALMFSGDVEPGGYTMRKGLGAVTAVFGLENPDYRYVVVEAGQRKGQIGNSLGEELDWNDEKIKEFNTQHPVCELIGQEGYLGTGKYLIHKDEDPEVVQLKMQESFRNKLEDIGVNESEISPTTITTIASLIQREAGGNDDMRLISRIIWNRLVKDMPLQIDATLQYIKGDEKDWWPVPRSEDKYLDSDFNTYQNTGLPPAPIATPSESAIKAAMNPAKTDCLYYLHDERGNIHCSTTYEGHKRNVGYYLK